MSSPAPATATADAEAPKKAKKSLGKKKLILMLAVVALVVVLGGGAAVFLLKKRAAAAEEGEGEVATETSDKKAEKVDPKLVPAFVPLEVFTVNLADREAERYAQIGITLELHDAKAADQIKNYMPAIRNNILMVLAHKTSAELLEREGKQKLAAEVLREAVRPLGYVIEAPEAAASGATKKKKAVSDDDPPPVKRVHFSNFIIQ